MVCGCSPWSVWPQRSMQSHVHTWTRILLVSFHSWCAYPPLIAGHGAAVSQWLLFVMTCTHVRRVLCVVFMCFKCLEVEIKVLLHDECGRLVGWSSDAPFVQLLIHSLHAIFGVAALWDRVLPALRFVCFCPSRVLLSVPCASMFNSTVSYRSSIRKKIRRKRDSHSHSSVTSVHSRYTPRTHARHAWRNCFHLAYVVLL